MCILIFKKNSTAQLLKEHGFDHQIIFYSTNADCSGLILIKDKPTPTIGSLISSTKTPVGDSHNRPERLTEQKVIYIRRLITYSKNKCSLPPTPTPPVSIKNLNHHTTTNEPPTPPDLKKC